MCDKFQFNPQVDLCTTRFNIQIDKYISWMSDPYRIAVSAFNFSWNPHKIYAFSHFSLVEAAILKFIRDFSLVGAAILKFIRDNTICIIIIP